MRLIFLSLPAVLITCVVLVYHPIIEPYVEGVLRDWQLKSDLSALNEVAATPELPFVLLIGDSISLGYTGPARTMLAGKANVIHPPVNCESTAKILANLDSWLGDKQWDVIHFNAGLHDLKYVQVETVSNTRPVPVGTKEGVQWVPVEKYRKNLELIVARLKRTGAKLIFATTTPVPSGAFSRLAGAEDAYNLAAKQVMANHNIPVDDLHAVARSIGAFQFQHDVHYTSTGSTILGAAVASSIDQLLSE